MRLVARVVSFLSLLIVSQAVIAQEAIPRAQRPLAIKGGEGLFTLDLSFDLSARHEGKRIEIGSFWPSQRHSGLTLALGVGKGWEIGGAVALVWHQSSATAVNRATGTTFGGFYVYGLWAFAEFLGIEVGMNVPSKVGWDRLRIKRLSFVFSIPARIVLKKDVLALKLRSDLVLGLARDYYNGDEGSTQHTLFGSVELVYNLHPRVFVEMSLGLGKVLQGRDIDSLGLFAQNDKPFLPLALGGGYTLFECFDIGGYFSFKDLYGSKADWRAAGLRVYYGF